MRAPTAAAVSQVARRRRARRCSRSCSSSRWSGWSCRASRPTRPSSRPRSRCPRSIDLVALGRGVGGRQPRPVRAQQRHRHRRVSVTLILAHRVLLRRSRSAAIRFRGRAARDGPLRAGAAAAAAGVLHRPVASCSRTSPSPTRAGRSSSRTRRWACRSRSSCSRSSSTRLPDELFEAARIDGAGDGRDLPRSSRCRCCAPGLATVAIFSALAAWNEFLLALLYIQNDDLKTIPTGLLAFSSPLPDGLLAALLGAVDRDHPDDRHLHRLQPPHRGRHHGRQRQVAGATQGPGGRPPRRLPGSGRNDEARSSATLGTVSKARVRGQDHQDPGRSVAQPTSTTGPRRLQRPVDNHASSEHPGSGRQAVRGPADPTTSLSRAPAPWQAPRRCAPRCPRPRRCPS